jgi:UDP-N-acetylmuramoylalanine--D-glutamate ligase
MVQMRTIERLPARVTVMGAARSGIAAARYLYEQGVSVFVSDACSAQQLDFILASNNLAHLAHESEEHTERALASDVIVLSPGIPSDLWLLKQARRRGIPVWSEMELGFRRSAAEFLAVTGSSGKSTTVSMLGEIMKASGRPTVVAGNIGVPVVSVAPQLPAEGVVVAEVSSFQLENIDTFCPRVASVLNFMKNHLDRYANEASYYDAKKAIAVNMDPGCRLVLNARDRQLRSWSSEIGERTNIDFFGRSEVGYACCWYEDGAIVAADRAGVRREILPVSEMILKGQHNYDNASAAAQMALAAGVPVEAIAEGLRTFAGLPHRLQLVGTYGGVSWYNDSKSTTAESVRVAVTAFEKNVHLIAGGRDKGCDFTVVNDVIPTHVRQVVLIGEAGARMQSVWKDFAPIVRADTLSGAVEAVANEAESGDTVVFSPGCSSFDMFRNYEERGLAFMSIVRDTVPGIVNTKRTGGRR